MSFFDTQISTAKEHLAGKVAVLTGGASGIGAATVRLFHASGASVVFGDISDEAGEKLAQELNAKSGDDRVTYVHVNVTSYDDNLKLFKTAKDKYGRVDHAIPIAGVGNDPHWFMDDFTIDDVQSPGKDILLEINLRGSLYFTRIALPYLRSGGGISAGNQKSLTLISSVAGFLDSSQIPLYAVTKHGLMGLMRALRGHEKIDVRVNCINPSFVSTAMTANVADRWRGSKLPECTPEYIAEVLVGIAIQKEIHGKAMFCSGMKAWDIEKGYKETKPQWMGDGYYYTTEGLKARAMAQHKANGVGPQPTG